jgi:TATA-box binding protein (TBP) (component of TFIID and TFIIIB)
MTNEIIKSLKLDANMDINKNDLIISKPKIATMTLTSKLNTNVNLLNCSKYILLTTDNIISVKYQNNKDSILIDRTLVDKTLELPKKKSKKIYKNGLTTSCFYNQCTLKIKVLNNKVVNLKLFKNGKVQMTGCKTLIDAANALNKLKFELKKEKYIKKDDNTITEIDIVNNLNFIIDAPSIQLINSVFDINLNINRNKLHSLLISKYNIHATFQPIIYVGINSKFIASSGNTISILIFQTGKIILTAARTHEDIDESYEFISSVLSNNIHMIIQ